MSVFKNTFIFLTLLALHVELLLVFLNLAYFLYFINLFIVLYLLNKYLKNYSFFALALHVAVVLVVINLDIYNEYLFEFLLNFNLLGKYPHIDSEIMYYLSAVHLFIFINLKRLVEFLGYNS